MVFHPKNEYDTRSCIACKAAIHLHARVCPNCHSPQSRFTNHFLSLANFGSSIAIVFGAVTFIASTAYNQFQLLNWRDSISLVSFEYPGELAIINNGYGDLLITSADVDWDQARRHVSIPLNLYVPAGMFKILPLESYYGAPDEIEHADWASLKLSSALPSILRDSAEDGKTRCSEFHFFARGHAIFDRIAQILKGQGSDLLTDSATWRLNMVSLHTGRPPLPAPTLPDLQVAFLIVGPTCNAAKLRIVPSTFMRTGGVVSMDKFRVNDRPEPTSSE
jgi:hypothetical protein